MISPISPKHTQPWLTVVISAGQSRNPEKRDLEIAVSEAAASLAGVEVLQIPHLYDLTKDSLSFQTIRQRSHCLVVIGWLFDRATHWVLDRNDIRGQQGEVFLHEPADEEEDSESDEQADKELNEDIVAHQQPRPNRQIFCIDFRASNNAQDFANEIARISELVQPEQDQLETAKTSLGSPLTLDLLQRMVNPTNDTYVGSTHLPIMTLDETPGRRWYPVIDFSRCTNCMECIDFCLFGVYGVDANETIVVEQADNCRKGCPACSRVCPQNAIMFPQHKTPAIAGAAVDAGSMKIDLSKLFGAPETNEDAATAAARERDEQLILAGRSAVGKAEGVEAGNAGNNDQPVQPRSTNDQLDQLLDQLDSLDL